MRQSRLHAVPHILALAVGCVAMAAFSSPTRAEDPNKPAPANSQSHSPGARSGSDHGHGAAPRPRGAEHHEFHHHDFIHFDARERGLWRTGRWLNTCFNGLCGWWWFAGGVWHFYDQPIYPYPPIVSDRVYVEPVVVAPPPVVVASPPVVAVPQTPPPTPLPTPAASQIRYYCEDPPGYFPAVQNCNGDFKPVAP